MSDDHSDLSQALAISTARKIAAIVEENDNGSGDIEACWLDIEKEIFSAIAKERALCAKICESSAKRYEELAIAARESRGPLSNSEANEYMWAAECARQQAKQIRGQNG